MSRNGAGTYVLPAGQPVVTGTTISSTVHNTLATDLANALTTSIATDGQSVVTANIPFAGYKLTGVGAATVNGDAIRYEDKVALTASITTLTTDSATKAGVQAQTYTAFTTAGSTTAYTLTPTPAIGSLVAGQRFRVKFNAANTSTTPTLAISGLAATAIKVSDYTGVKRSPQIGALAINSLMDIEYDGADYVVLCRLAAFTEPYVSAATAFTNGTPVTFTHGLSGEPREIAIVLENINAIGGYTTGQHMPFNLSAAYDGAASRGFAIKTTSTTVVICASTNTLQAVSVANGVSFSVSPTDWNLIVKAWY